MINKELEIFIKKYGIQINQFESLFDGSDKRYKKLIYDVVKSLINSKKKSKKLNEELAKNENIIIRLEKMKQDIAEGGKSETDFDADERWQYDRIENYKSLNMTIKNCIDVNNKYINKDSEFIELFIDSLIYLDTDILDSYVRVWRIN